MNSIKEVIVNGSIKSVQSLLIKPPGQKPENRLIQISEWYNKLNDSEKSIVIQIIKESVEMGLFAFLCVLDGVKAIENTDKGVFKLYYENGNEKVLLNNPENDYLHNFL
jgi:hypothetical protein